MAPHVERFGDRLRRRLGAAQITGVDHSDLFVAKPVDELAELCAASCVQFWIGVSAKGAGHVSLCMANEKKLAHIVHTPQK